jgi:hypothetical protein
MRIPETQAARTEVLEAFTLASAGDQIGTELEHGLRGVAHLESLLPAGRISDRQPTDERQP